MLKNLPIASIAAIAIFQAQVSPVNEIRSEAPAGGLTPNRPVFTGPKQKIEARGGGGEGVLAYENDRGARRKESHFVGVASNSFTPLRGTNSEITN